MPSALELGLLLHSCCLIPVCNNSLSAIDIPYIDVYRVPNYLGEN